MKIEIKIKELELYQKIDEHLRMKGTPIITRQVNKTINFFIENPRIQYIEIDGIEIPKNIDKIKGNR